MSAQKLLHTLQKQHPIFLDTACFIYTFEDHPQFSPLTTDLFDAISQEKIIAYTSVITVSEVLTKPYELNNNPLAKQYEEIFAQLPNLEIANPNYETARNAARIKAENNFHLIDSYQLALALEHSCKSFVTNDKKLTRFKSELDIIYLSKFI